MEQSNKIIKYVITISILIVLAYAVTVFAEPFKPGATLDPSCGPGDRISLGDTQDCFVDEAVSNGLNKLGGDIKLGGDLLEDTTISALDKELSFTRTNGFNFLSTDDALGFGLPFTGMYRFDNSRHFMNGQFLSGSNILNYITVYNEDSGEETTLEVGYFNNFPGGARQAILLKGGAVTTHAESTEMYIADNVITVRAKGNTSGDVVLTGEAYNGNTEDNVFEFTGDGNLHLSAYENTRNDSLNDSPINFLYTDNTGNLRSAPLVQMTGVLPDYPDTSTAGQDGALASGSYFKIKNGDGTSSVHIKD